ncbi:hypothetical protein EJ08DRAFT_694533 [Tothia fuscella]|uniref:Uncharacterized protein n=1 Tax=Tothia fuscella TaxID=1048955 RepID=A0A9P4NYU6_9PEZI|nr:hypothetical protein EJ08DRAFT_694533 [Tothia fuscella]
MPSDVAGKGEHPDVHTTMNKREMSPSQPASSVHSRPQKVQLSAKRGIRQTSKLIPVLNELDGLVKTQEKLIGYRVKAQQARKVLKRYKEEAAERDASLIAAVRKARSTNTELTWDILGPLADACEATRDNIGPLEYDYEKLDLRLVPLEDDISTRAAEIERLYTRICNGLPIEDNGSDTSSTGSSGNETSLVEHRTVEIQPTLLELGTDMGRNETYNSEINASQQQAEPNAVDTPDGFDVPWRRHQPVNISLGKTLRPVLSRYAPDLRSERSWGLARTLHDTDEDNSSGTEHGRGDLEPEFGRDQAERGENLLSMRREDTHTSSSGDISDVDSAHRRVNRWILHKLRISRWEIQRLRASVLSETESMRDWTNLALSCWEHDDAALSPHYPNSEETLSVTAEGSYSSSNFPLKYMSRNRAFTFPPSPSTWSLHRSLPFCRQRKYGRSTMTSIKSVHYQIPSS